MNKQHDDINEILKSAKKYSVSAQKDAQIKRNLSALKPISLTNVFMNAKKFAAVVAALAIVAVVGFSGVFQAGTTYASHLENAEKALQELQLLQNSGEEVNQERVQELMQEVVSETNAAMALAENESEGTQLQKALGEVKAVQEKSMSMFQKFEGEDNDAVMTMTREMQQKHERVMEMLGEQSGEQVKIQAHLEEAEQALNQLQEMQKNGEDTDPEQVRELAQKVVQSTNSALEEAKGAQEGEQMQQALQEVQQVQEKAMEMFKQYEGEEMGEQLKEAQQQHAQVQQMLGAQAGR